MARTEAPDLPHDPTAAAAAVAAELPPELVAQTFGQYARAYAVRIRNGESGVLPVVVGLVAIMVVFEVISPNHVFLSAGNLVNLFTPVSEEAIQRFGGRARATAPVT